MSFFRVATDADGTRVELKYDSNQRVTQREKLIARSLGLDSWEEEDAMANKLQQVLIYTVVHVKNPQAGITKDKLRDIFIRSVAHLTRTKHDPGVNTAAYEDVAAIHEMIADDLDFLLTVLVNSGDVIEIASDDILL